MALERWRIDAWAVRDGAVFASRRESDSRDAQITVFLAVPDLEPVPVGRLSTALSATRRNFQTGLRDGKGNEIPFESLDAIAELVRRGFLASGLGPGGSGAPAPVGGPPAPPPVDEGWRERDERPRDRPLPGGGAHYEQAIATVEGHQLPWFHKQSPRETLEIFANDMETAHQAADGEPLPGLRKLIDAYAEAVTIDWEQRVAQRPDPQDLRMLVDWYAGLFEIGIWDDIGQAYDFVREHDGAVGRGLLQYNWQPPWNVKWLHEVVGTRQQLMSYAPCPRRSRWLPGLTRLAEKLTLPMCIGNYFDHNPELPELAPAILGAMLLTAGAFPSALVTPVSFRQARLATAMRWLSQDMPRMYLPSDVEDLVNDYAWHQLDVPVAK
jgi:hypothetical protein